jgi:hypothetical protein
MSSRWAAFCPGQIVPPARAIEAALGLLWAASRPPSVSDVVRTRAEVPTFEGRLGARNVVNALNTEGGHAIIATTDHTGPIIQHVGSPVHAGSNLDARGPMIHQHLAGKRKSQESMHVGRPVHPGSSLDELDPMIHLH